MRRTLTRREWAQLAGLVAVSLTVLLLLPFGAGYGFPGLATWPWRAAGALVVFALGLLLLAWRWHRRRRLLAPARGGMEETATPFGGPAEELRLAIAEALSWTHEREARATRLGEGAYALPWILLAGAAGSGRTSLIRAAGFATEPQARPMAGGTVWLGEQAVLIEPPGAWFAQGAEPAPVLALAAELRRARPRRPLDGVVMTVTAAALTVDPRAAMTGLRARLQQVMRSLEAEPPLHVAVTGADRLPGFLPAFARDEGGEAVLGALRHGGGDALALLRPPILALARGAGQRLAQDMAAERDVGRRAALLLWPGQLDRLAAAALLGLDELMRHGPGDRKPDLRGLHLVSAPGAAGPAADAWHDALAEAFALDGRLPAPPAPSGPLFAAGLLRGLVLPQAGSGGANPRAERREAAWHLGGYALAGALLGLLGIVWGASFAIHHAAQTRAGVELERLSRMSSALHQEADPPIGRILPVLDGISAVTDIWHGAGEESWLSITLPSPEIARDAAQRAQDRMLVAHLLPWLRTRMAEQMTAATDLAQLRGLLRLYLASADAEHYDAAAFRSWGEATLNGALALDPRARAKARQHLARLAAILPSPGGLNAAMIAETRSRLRARPEAERLYAELRGQAERSSLAPPLDVVGSLGVSGAQLLMLRHQAGLPVVVPGLYTRAGFFALFLPRLPALLEGEADDAFVMGTTTQDGEAAELLRRVTQLYIADYVRIWRGVVDQTALRALPDLPSLVGGLQALSGPDSPLAAFVALVRDNTDLQPPTDQAAAGLLGRAAQAVGGAAVQAAVGAAAAAGASLPGGARDWPGNAIREPFLPMIALAGPPGGGTQNARLLGPLSTAFGALSGIASAASPPAAAHQAAAGAVGGQQGDPFAVLRIQAATLPKPVDAIFRDLHANIWSVVLSLTLERVVQGWNTDVAPACLQTVARRYPFAGATAELDVLPRDFAAFFGPNGVLDRWTTQLLLPFTQVAADGSLVPAGRAGLRLALPADALAQVNRARLIRDLFFDSAGNLGMRVSLTPAFLDARALSATLQLDQQRQVYRHEPPRPIELRWPGAEEGGNALVSLTMLDGAVRSVERGGAWALFRLLDAGERETAGDRQRLAFALGDARVAYALRGSTARNPLTIRDWRDFRCIPRL